MPGTLDQGHEAPPPDVPQALQPRPRWGIPSAVVGVVLFIGLQLLIGAFVVVGWMVTGHHGTPPALTLALVSLLPAYAGVLGWQYLVARRKGDGVRRDYAFAFRWYDLFVGAAGGLAAMGVMLLGTLAVAKLFGVTPESSVGTTVLDSKQTGVPLYALLVVIAFVGPVVEELHFRGMWWRAIANRFGPVAALLVTSAIFAVVHLEPVRLLGLLLGGLVLGGLRL
ncbi:MAG: CPBP family intramembrane metalloprotease, partial [Streptosporangiales bacterium]|nr:CPBP family intramembrane metalloprotease [Streptosporangiales bacterium]